MLALLSADCVPTLCDFFMSFLTNKYYSLAVFLQKNYLILIMKRITLLVALLFTGFVSMSAPKVAYKIHLKVPDVTDVTQQNLIKTVT